MSLLLEALKKAELAKQSSLGSASPAEESPLGEIRFEEPVEPAIRRPAVKDFDAVIAEPAPAAPPPAPEPPAAAPRPANPAPLPEAEPVSQATPDPQRAAARQLFDVKEVDYNPKRPFYMTLGALGLAACGYGGYLWWQLQPRTTVNTAAVQNAPKSAPIAKSLAPPPPDTPPAGEAASAPGTPVAEAADPAVAVAAAKPPGAESAVPAKAAPAAATTAAKPAAETASAPMPSTFTRQGQGAAVAAPSTEARSPSPARAETPRQPVAREARLPIKVTPPAFQANEVLESAYAALQRGELDRARIEYQQVLGREINNRDALLGLAAIDVRTRDFDTAGLRYMKLLELDPRDSYANAGLIALQGNIDPVQTESRLKSLIATQPEANHLYFTLGNQYAAQARWAEAQDAYFKAFSADPGNADFAFNLAVSLDQLRQRKPASEYYRKALSLAGSRSVGFDRKQAETRAKELER